MRSAFIKAFIWLACVLLLSGKTAHAAPIYGNLLVREYYNAALHDYVLSATAQESALIDAGRFAGWSATGNTFGAFASDSRQPADTVPVCRYYGQTSAIWSSHFYSGNPAECSSLGQQGGTWTSESDAYFAAYLPEATSGACPAHTTALFRAFDPVDAGNHRFLLDRGVRDELIGIGWLAEGYGPDAVALCVPPSPDLPVSPTERVRITEDAGDGPTWLRANNVLGVPWKNEGGDWVDASGVPQGRTPYAVIPASAFRAVGWKSAEVGPLVEKLRTDNTGFFLHLTVPEHAGAPGPWPAAAKFASRNHSDPTLAPTLKVTTTTGTFDCPVMVDTWLAWDSAYPQSAATTFSNPAILRFDLSAVSGIVQSATLSIYHGAYGGEDLAIDYLDIPRLLTLPATQLPQRVEQGIAATVANDADLASHPAVLLRVDPSPASMNTSFQQGWWDKGASSPDAASYVRWDEYGIPAIRVANSDLGTTAINIRNNFVDYPTAANRKSYQQPWGSGAPDHLFLRYLIELEPDVSHRMPPGSPYPYSAYEGTKLPGFQGSRDLIGYTGWPADGYVFDDGWGMNLEHDLPSPVHDDAMGFGIYAYDMDTVLSNPGRGQYIATGAALVRNHVYSLELEVKMNSTTNGVGNRDGVLNVWLDGVKVWGSTTRKWRNKPAVGIMQAAMLLMAGGRGAPIAQQHYRIGGWTVASQYIGPPKRITPGPPAWPAWRQGLPAGQFTPIAGTARMSGTTDKSVTIDAWNGLAAGPHAWWAAANGGHGDSAENKVYAIDLSADRPAWTVMNAGSSATGAPDAHYYPDGLPASRHSYYTAQFIAKRNRVMLFTSAALWGSGNGSGLEVDGFDPAGAQWDPPGTWASAPFGWNALAVAKHPLSEDVYIARWGNGPQKYAKWSQATNVWSSILPRYPAGSRPGAWEFHPSTIDATRNRWVSLNAGPANSGVHLQTINLANNTFSTLAVAGALKAIGGYDQVVHDADSDRYVAAVGNGDGSAGIYAIDPNSAYSTLLATVQGPLGSTGINGRFAYFKELGGIAYLPRFESDILFMPTR